MQTEINRFVRRIAGLAMPVALAACGGGGGGTNSTPNPNPIPTVYTATCWDGTKPTSTVSQAAADALCPADTRSTLVASVPNGSYTGVYADEKLAVLNRLNDDRSRCGFGKIAQNTLLDQAAQNHADYLVANNLAEGHSETLGKAGYTGANSASRVAYTGYRASQTGEGISRDMFWGTASGNTYSVLNGGKTFYIPLTANPPLVDGLRGLYAAPYHLRSLMIGYREIGIGSYYKDYSSTFLTKTAFAKALVMNYATPANQQDQKFSTDTVTTFPCNGTQDLTPYFPTEDPNPFAEMNVGYAWGQPVYVMARPGANLELTSGTITLRGGAAVPTKRLVCSTCTGSGSDVRQDPHSIIGRNEVFLVPTEPLAENATYDVVLQGTNSLLVTTANPSGGWSKSFSFSTSVDTKGTPVDSKGNPIQ